MSDNKGYKIIALVALVLGVIGVTLGYAAFSSTLTISSSAEVRPEGSLFNVDFSSSSTSVVTDSITPTLNKTVDGFSATNATIDNTTNPTITGLKATFTEPGQSATYTFYSYNAGEYIAYLNSIVFSGEKACTPKEGTTASLVASACTGISLSVKVGTESATTTSVAAVTGHALAKATGEEIVVVISYDNDAARADGDFDVTLPNVILTYDSVD